MSYYTRTISAAQKGQFWRVFRDACFALGLQGKIEQSEYRHKLLKECCGKEHLNDLNTTTDYEAVMHRLSIDAGDFARAAKYAVADTHRVAMLVKIECCQILQLKGADEGAAFDYLAGLLQRSRLADSGHNSDARTYWLDVPPGNVSKLLAILDTYRRKLVREFLTADKVIDSTGFFPGHRYTVCPYNRIPVKTAYYADLETVQVNVR